MGIIVGCGFGCSSAARKARLEYALTSAAQRFHSNKRGAAGALTGQHHHMSAGVEQHESAEHKETWKPFKKVAKTVTELESTQEDAPPKSQDGSSPKKKWKFGKKIGGLIKRNERL